MAPGLAPLPPSHPTPPSGSLTLAANMASPNKYDGMTREELIARLEEADRRLAEADRRLAEERVARFLRERDHIRRTYSTGTCRGTRLVFDGPL